MLPAPIAALLVALLSSSIVQEVAGAAPLLTLPLQPRTLHNSISHRPAAHWENVKNGLRAKYGYGESKVAALKAIQHRQELAKRAVGTFGLTDLYWDTEYTVPLSIGTPPQQFNVIPDTGGSETWVLGSQCVLCSGATRFNESKSSTYTPIGVNVNFKYGSGDVTAQLAYETVSMGGFKSENERISFVIQATQGFLDASISGLLGLGFPALMITANSIPWWIRLIQDGQLGQGETLFAFWFSRYWGTPQTASIIQVPGGQFTLGGVNSSLFVGQINYIPLSQVSWWTIPMDSVVVNNHEITLTTTNKNVIVDTGTTLVGGPKEVLDVIYSSINGSKNAGDFDFRYEGYYLIPCSTMNTVSLGFKFGGQTYTFTGIDLILDDVSSTPGLEGMCLSAIFVLGHQPGGIGGPAWVVGDAFLKNVYSVFRYETTVTGAITGSVGFARLSGVDGRLITTGAPMYSYSYSPTSTSALNVPSSSSASSSVGPIPDPLTINNVTPNRNGASSSRLQLKYGALLVCVSLLLSLVW